MKSLHPKAVKVFASDVLKGSAEGAKNLAKRKDVRQAAIVGGTVGSITGSAMGDRKGKLQSDAMYKSAGIFKASKSAAEKSLKAMAKKMPSAKRVGKSLGLAATVAGTGYIAHKATEALQTPVSRVGRNIENTYLGKKKITKQAALLTKKETDGVVKGYIKDGASGGLSGAKKGARWGSAIGAGAGLLTKGKGIKGRAADALYGGIGGAIVGSGTGSVIGNTVGAIKGAKRGYENRKAGTAK